MIILDLHVGVGLTRMIDVMSAIAATTAIQTPSLIDTADAQLSAAGPPPGFGIGNSFTRVFRDFPVSFEVANRETALPFDWGFPD